MKRGEERGGESLELKKGEKKGGREGSVKLKREKKRKKRV